MRDKSEEGGAQRGMRWRLEFEGGERMRWSYQLVAAATSLAKPRLTAAERRTKRPWCGEGGTGILPVMSRRHRQDADATLRFRVAEI